MTATGWSPWYTGSAPTVPVTAETQGVGRAPDLEHIAACRPWLEAELQNVKPVIVCLGATAAQAMLGRSFRVTKQRGEFLVWDDGSFSAAITATLHPSAILRAPSALRDVEIGNFVQDLTKVAEKLAELP